MEEFDEVKSKKLLEIGYSKAKEVLDNEEDVEKFLIEVENKIKAIPVKDVNLGKVPNMISLVRSYINKEYTNISKENITIIISALLYLVAPIDVIPDSVPGIGYSDDIGIIKFALKLVNNNLDEYIKNK